MLRLAAFAVTSALAASVAGPLPPLPLGRLLAPPDRLTITMADTGNRRLDREYRLECGPVGGDHPEAEGACARLDQFARRGRTPSPPSPSGRSAPCSTGAPPPPGSPEHGTATRWTPRSGGPTDAKSAAGTSWNLCFRVGVPDLGGCAGWAVYATHRPPHRGPVALDSSRDLPVVVVREEARREQQAIPRRCSPRSNTRCPSGRAVARQRQRHGRQREFDRARNHGEPRHRARGPGRARPPARVRLQADPRLHAPARRGRRRPRQTQEDDRAPYRRLRVPRRAHQRPSRRTRRLPRAATLVHG